MSGGLLHLSGISKRYARGRTQVRVLEGVDLELAAGELACVLGMRGAGKTTLLRIAAGMESPDRGQVRFEGTDLVGLPDRELSQLLGAQIAWAGRGGPGMPMRMLDYVAMPLLARRGGSDPYARAHEALTRVGAAGCADQQWETMSDWERALAELAQAIAGDPRLLLIDDLTDTLGIRETNELTALVRELTRERGMGVLMSVSDAKATLWADRMLTLHDGQLSEGLPVPATGSNVVEFPDVAAARRAGHGGA